MLLSWARYDEIVMDILGLDLYKDFLTIQETLLWILDDLMTVLSRQWDHYTGKTTFYNVYAYWSIVIVKLQPALGDD